MCKTQSSHSDRCTPVRTIIGRWGRGLLLLLLGRIGSRQETIGQIQTTTSIRGRVIRCVVGTTRTAIRCWIRFDVNRVGRRVIGAIYARATIEFAFLIFRKFYQIEDNNNKKKRGKYFKYKFVLDWHTWTPYADGAVVGCACDHTGHFGIPRDTRDTARVTLEHTDGRFFFYIPYVHFVVLAAARHVDLVGAAERRKVHVVVLNRAVETTQQAFVFDVPQVNALRCDRDQTLRAWLV